jgi:DNA-binding NtrC family response regulator
VAGEEQSSLKSLVRSAKGEAERSAIAHALEETHWNRKAAARLLSISYRALLYKIQEYRMVPPHDTQRLYS